MEIFSWLMPCWYVQPVLDWSSYRALMLEEQFLGRFWADLTGPQWILIKKSSYGWKKEFFLLGYTTPRIYFTVETLDLQTREKLTERIRSRSLARHYLLSYLNNVGGDWCGMGGMKAEVMFGHILTLNVSSPFPQFPLHFKRTHKTKAKWSKIPTPSFQFSQFTAEWHNWC